MNKKVQIEVTEVERTAIVASLMSFANYDEASSFVQLARRISAVPEFDPANDGPEVEALRHLAKA